MLVLALLLAAPLRPGDAALSVRLETAYLQPDGDATRRGGGAGLSFGYRLTDQLSVVGGASASLLWSLPDAGGTQKRQRLTMVSAGLEALLDATPVAPFLELCMVRLLPESAAGYSLATRTSLGADWLFSAPFAVGLAVRTLTPLDNSGAVNLPFGTEVALRFTWTPAARRPPP
ncbi:MAG: hypothetical protein ACJ79H_03240 [Myxococcales bacterium]